MVNARKEPVKPPMTIDRPHFLSLTAPELITLVGDLGQPGFRGSQLVDWIYEKRAISPAEMTNLPKALRQDLDERLDWSLPTLIERLDSADGASKLLLKNSKGQSIETVILRYEERTSLCVSSQVGCKLACSFCQTGKLGFFANLSAAEILGQYLLAQRIVAEEGRRISHVVFMGMGEPLDNYDNAIRAANTLISQDGGFGLSQRHVTLSTSGIVPRIISLADACPAALAVSLHAARDDLRTELMPINRKYPLAALKDAMAQWQAKSGRKVTIEYILIAGKNSSARDAMDLVRFLSGLKAKVNLIPFNPHPGLPYERPSADEIRSFQAELAKRSIPAPVRYSLGLDVSGACGQLAAKSIANLDASPSRKRVVESGIESIGL